MINFFFTATTMIKTAPHPLKHRAKSTNRPMGPFILASLVPEEAVKKNESKLGSFKKHFHHNYSGGTGRSSSSR